MELYTLTSDSDVSSPPSARSGVWVQFGETIVFSESLEHALGENLEAKGKKPLRTVQRQNLFVVSQVGNDFIRQNPDVEILLNKGRFLLVNLMPEKVTELGDCEHSCFSIFPVVEPMVVYRPQVSQQRLEVDPVLQAQVDKLSENSYRDFLGHISGYPTRHSSSHSYTECVAWASNKLEGWGYSVQEQPFQRQNLTTKNLIAKKSGSLTSDKREVIICAHLDSVNHEDGIDGSAPGADDNGSGSAGVLEIARVLANSNFPNDLTFVLFGGEEQGLFGSYHFVGSLNTEQKRRVSCVINMDMIGTQNTDTISVLVEGKQLSESLINTVARFAETYGNLDVSKSLMAANSDHVPFLEKNMPAVLTIEGADQSNNAVHSSRDLLQRINYELCMKILRTNVASAVSFLQEE